MFFRVYVIFIIVGYICYFVGMIAYDLLLNFRKGSQKKHNEEETVDISGEMAHFKPTLIRRQDVPQQTMPTKKRKTRVQMLEEITQMSGGIEVSKLVATVEEAKKENGDVGSIMNVANQM